MGADCVLAPMPGGYVFGARSVWRSVEEVEAVRLAPDGSLDFIFSGSIGVEHLAGSVGEGPAVSGPTVYLDVLVPAGPLRWQAHVLALDFGSRKVAWTHRCVSGMQVLDLALARPRSLVVRQVGTEPPDEGRIDVLDRTSGERRWCLPWDQASLDPVREGMLVAGRGVLYCVHSYGSHLAVAEAWSISSGRLRWCHPLEHLPCVAPVIVDDALLSAGLVTLYCLDARTGDLRWKRNVSAPIRRLASAAGRICLATIDRVLCLDAGSGRARWEHGYPDGMPRSRLHADGTRLLVVLEDRIECLRVR
jgi:hypothetical protein